ncbi:hypothetical protein V6N13_033457 [Hibiscus sabdariffa]
MPILIARNTEKGLLHKKGVLAVVIVSSALVFLILVIFLRCWVQRQTRERTRKGKNIFSLTTFEESLGEKEINGSTTNGDLPYFDLSIIAAATNDFSSDNKLGQVVSMLSKEATLPSPEPPAFIEKNGHNGYDIWNSDGANSVNAVRLCLSLRFRQEEGLGSFPSPLFSLSKNSYYLRLSAYARRSELPSFYSHHQHQYQHKYITSAMSCFATKEPNPCTKTFEETCSGSSRRNSLQSLDHPETSNILPKGL